MISAGVPLLGLCAPSGTGKTTLLRHLLPLLKKSGLRVAVIKRAHPGFQIDLPGKDSYELRAAGAEQILVASCRRVALVREIGRERTEPGLVEMVGCLDTRTLDLVLVEGYKQEAIPKIELHRHALGLPLLHPHISHVIAVATDRPLRVALPQLDLNNPPRIADFIRSYIDDTRDSRHADTPDPHRPLLCRRP